MGIKGGIVDASGEKLVSVRLVTDSDANSGIGSQADPVRVDPTGTTVQPVSITGSPSVSGTVTANQGGTWTDRIVGNAGATLDAAPGATAPAAAIQVAGVSRDGKLRALSTDINGSQRVLGATLIPTIIQKASSAATSSSATSVQLTLPNAVKVGNTVVVVAMCGTATTPKLSVADNLNNIYVSGGIGVSAQSMNAVAMFGRVLNGGSCTLTLTRNGTATALGLYAWEVEGIGELDSYQANSTAGATSLQIAQAPTTSGEIAFYVIGTGAAATISLPSPATPTTTLLDSGSVATGSSGSLTNFAAASAILGPVNTAFGTQDTPNSTPYTVTFNLSNSVAALGIVVIFRPVAVEVMGTVTTVLPILVDAVSNTVPVPRGKLVATTNTTESVASTAAGLAYYPGLPFLFNGTTWDRQRGNVNTTTGDSPTIVSATTTNGAAQTNFNHRGAVITIITGTISGTSPTLSAQLQWSPDGGTTWLNIGAATSTVNTTGNTITLWVYPTNSSTAGATPAALTTGATVTSMMNAALPRTWRLNYITTGTGISVAISSVQVNYIL